MAAEEMVCRLCPPFMEEEEEEEEDEETEAFVRMVVEPQLSSAADETFVDVNDEDDDCVSSDDGTLTAV